MAACTANYTGQLHLYCTVYFICIILSVIGTWLSVGPLNDAILKMIDGHEEMQHSIAGTHAYMYGLVLKKTEK